MEQDDRTMTFALLADVQYAQKPTADGRYYAQAKDRLAECVATLNAQQPGPAFVMQLGDLIDGGDQAHDELTAAAAIYHRLRMPRYHVLGNHDFDGLRREQTLAILAMERAYYAFDRNGWRFVVLDTQDVAVQGGWGQDSKPYQTASAMLESLRRQGADNAQPYNGAAGDAQLAWLDEVLTDADAKTMPAVVFGHLPLVPFGEKHTLWNAEAVVALLERHPCVKAYVCGHTHRGGRLRQNGIEYISLEAVVEHADQAAVWYTVDLTSSAIDIKAVGTAQRWTLPLQ